MADEVQVLPSPLKGGHPPAVKAGGKRISKKQEIGVLERHTRKTGSEKTSAIVNVAKIQTMDALNDTLEKRFSISDLLTNLQDFLKCSLLQIRNKQVRETPSEHTMDPELEVLSHKFPAIVHTAHQKPRPALEKVTPMRRIYIIQQPRKC